MIRVRRLAGTIRIIGYAIGVVSSAAAPSPYRHCNDFNDAVDEQGHLEIFFPDCFSPAAVALLFRLKRQGFSRCRATVQDGGIVLTADR